MRTSVLSLTRGVLLEHECVVLGILVEKLFVLLLFRLAVAVVTGRQYGSKTGNAAADTYVAFFLPFEVFANCSSSMAANSGSR